MKKKHRQLLVTAMAYLFMWSSGTSTNVWAAASGNYTDLLPVGAAGNTTVISNGSGWSLTTLPPSTTFGDALSRAPYTAYELYVTSTVTNTTNISTITALTGSSSVGSTTFPASWVSSGRSIRISSRGKYTTTGAAVNWTWDCLLGTATILNTGAVAAVPNQTNQWFSATALLTVSTTGASGTVNGVYDIIVSSGGTLGGTSNVLAYSTVTASAVAVDLTSQLTINPRFTWGTAATGNSITFNNVVIEFLN